MTKTEKEMFEFIEYVLFQLKDIPENELTKAELNIANKAKELWLNKKEN